MWTLWVNTFRPRQNGRHFVDDIFKYIFLNENVWIPIKIWLKFVPKGRINNIPALVQIIAWRRPGDKPLSEPMLVSLPTHICVIRPQWVNRSKILQAWHLQKIGESVGAPLSWYHCGTMMKVLENSPNKKWIMCSFLWFWHFFLFGFDFVFIFIRDKNCFRLPEI